jgi:hypothetical protein
MSTGTEVAFRLEQDGRFPSGVECSERWRSANRLEKKSG